MPYLYNIDPEINIPSKVNFDDYNIHEFHNSNDIRSTILYWQNHFLL